MLNYSANGPSGYNLTNSLRFRSSASAYLNRTPSSTTNRQTFTWSSWVKRGALGVRQHLFVSANPVVNTVGQQEFQIAFASADHLEISGGTSGVGNDISVNTVQLFRDPSAWYHIVVAIDTTQATNTNRVKVYVNGSQVTSFQGGIVYPSQNYNTSVNLINFSHRIGGSGTNYLDAYLTEMNFIDGQALTPSSFGNTNSTTGVWQPAKYTGTYGTNGFYLNFSSIALTSGSNTGLGKDNSGNGNYWNTNNISVTAGTTYDAMTDVPTLTSTTAANYCVLNPLQAYTGAVYSGNLLTYGPAPYWIITPSTFWVSSGKWYWEVTQASAGGTTLSVGIGGTQPLYQQYTTTNYLGATSDAYAYYGYNGQKQNNGSSVAYGATYTTNDVIGVALDLDAGTLTFYKNNVSQGVAYTGISGTFTPAIGSAGGNQGYANFGQQGFKYTPPTGYKALNTYNLPTSTIVQGNKYMDATLYTGAGGTSNITTLTFQPDLIWVKNRSNAVSHCWVDSNRGAPNQLGSDLTAAENSGGNDRTVYGGISTILSNGFTAVSGTDPTYKATNGSGQTYVAWYWKANQGTNTSNTSGSITSTVSVNASAGFSVVTYTGTGANATVGHGLGVAPSMIIA